MSIFSNVQHPLKTGIGLTSDNSLKTDRVAMSQENLEIHAPVGVGEKEFGVFRASFGVLQQTRFETEESGNWLRYKIMVDVILKTDTPDLLAEASTGFGHLPLVKSGEEELKYQSAGASAGVFWRPNLGNYQFALGGKLSILKDMVGEEGYGEAVLSTELGLRRFFHISENDRVYVNLGVSAGFVAPPTEIFPYCAASLNLGFQHDVF